jgi:beta-N-acetylhexosaminidase
VSRVEFAYPHITPGHARGSDAAMRGGVKRRNARRAAIAVAAVALSIVGCSSSPTVQPSASTIPGTTAAAPSLPAGSPTAPLPTAAPACAEATLAGLTEAQRVGQLFMVGMVADTVPTEIRDAVASAHIGNAWYRRTKTGVTAIRAVSDRIQALATTRSTGGVPFLISANQEGGQVQGLTGPGFDTIPSAVVQGSWSPDHLGTAASVWGGQLLDAGVNTDFAPVSDVVPPGADSTNAPIGRLQREYGHDPERVSAHVLAFITGMHEAGVATTAKHLPGLGRVEGNTDNTAVVVDDTTTVDDPNLEPFRTAIQEGGTEFVMVSEAIYTKIDPDHLALFSSRIMRDLLRGDLGFEGVIMSDSLSATAVINLSPGTRAIRFLEAGGDLIVLNPITQATAMVRAVLARTGTNATFRARVDDAALRVLVAKDEAGLLSCSA